MGASQEQVLVVMGTPSTVATVSGEAFYYISQRSERAIGFMPQQVVDQRVIAIYFDKNRRVERLANYGMKDGKVFDFVTRTTPTGGKDFSYVSDVPASARSRRSRQQTVLGDRAGRRLRVHDRDGRGIKKPADRPARVFAGRDRCAFSRAPAPRAATAPRYW